MSSADPGTVSPRPDSHDRAPIRLAILDDHEVLLDSLGSWITANALDFSLVLRA